MGKRHTNKPAEPDAKVDPATTDEPEPFELIISDPDEDVDDYTDDEEILEDFMERQDLYSEPNKLTDLLDEHNSESPALTGGDVDARWDLSNMVGEEGVGGSVQTPDKDVVDELGEAVGLTYNWEEPLHTWEKLHERDTDRWELNPASADDEED
jgi:hypothetical protein